jgi:hypothetical protein
LRWLAPSAVQERRGSRKACSRWGFGILHDPHECLDCLLGVLSGEIPYVFKQFWASAWIARGALLKSTHRPATNSGERGSGAAALGPPIFLETPQDPRGLILHGGSNDLGRY